MLLEAQNSLIRESKTRERRCSIEKNKRRFMLWFFHSRVFPRPGNRTGDQATGIFLSLSEQESHFKSSPFSLPKSIIPDVCLNRNLRTNSTHTHTQSYLLWYLTISHVHMRFRIGDSSNESKFFEGPKSLWYPFFRGRRRHELLRSFGRYLFKIHFGYQFLITTQKGESKSRICPFSFSRAAFFWASI